MFILSRDAIKRSLFGLHDVGIPQNAIAFRSMIEALPILLTSGTRVIVDGMPFSRVGQSEAIEAIASTMSVESCVLYLDCPESIAGDRLQQHDPVGPSDRDAALVNRVASSFRRIPDHWRRLDATQSPASVHRSATVSLRLAQS
jgi:predicted kinase